jgi:hypothetical protein
MIRLKPGVLFPDVPIPSSASPEPLESEKPAKPQGLDCGPGEPYGSQRPPTANLFRLDGEPESRYLALVKEPDEAPKQPPAVSRPSMPEDKASGS